MNKVAIVKIAGFLVVPILVMLVVIYFLYPLLNSEKYDLIVKTKGTMVDSATMDSLARLDSLAHADSMDIYRQLNIDDKIAESEERWAGKVDSLTRMIYLLNSRLEGLETPKETSQTQNSSSQEGANAGQTSSADEEDFKDRVKSLLALDEKEMAPILSKMSKDQLVLLYKEAGNTQREKILRALSSDRAAQLITEIML